MYTWYEYITQLEHKLDKFEVSDMIFFITYADKKHSHRQIVKNVT